MERWIRGGVRPGGFLLAVLENDLLQAYKRADRESWQHVSLILDFLYDVAPCASWGSKERVKEWQAGFTEDDESSDSDRPE
jgi:hypothetical protein